MFRKIFAALLVAVALAAGIGAVPGFFDNVAFASCDMGDPACD